MSAAESVNVKADADAKLENAFMNVSCENQMNYFSAICNYNIIVSTQTKFATSNKIHDVEIETIKNAYIELNEVLKTFRAVPFDKHVDVLLQIIMQLKWNASSAVFKITRACM